MNTEFRWEDVHRTTKTVIRYQRMPVVIIFLCSTSKQLIEECKSILQRTEKISIRKNIYLYIVAFHRFVYYNHSD